MIDPIYFIIIPIVLFSLTVHEYSHALASYKLGDDTAKRLGRLTLNPLKHLDPLGTLAILIIKFGWAKPVPVNINRLKRGRKSLYVVALAGPLSNFIIALVFSVLFYLIGLDEISSNTVLYDENFLNIGKFMSWMIYLNIMLGVFNLLPMPPLDGGNIIYSILPDSLADKFNQTMSNPFYSILSVILIIFIIRSYPYLLLAPISFILNLLAPDAILYLNG